MRRTAILLLFAASSAACTLTRRAGPLDVHYYTPESAPTRLTSAVSDGLALRLGRVRAASYLDKRMVRRAGTHEVVYDERSRWTEDPADYVRRALARALFEERGLESIQLGPGPTLDVEVVAFDEAVVQDAAVAHIALRYVLYDGRKSLVEDTLVVDRPLAPLGAGADDVPAFVVAMTEALTAATEALAARVATALEDAAPP